MFIYELHVVSHVHDMCSSVPMAIWRTSVVERVGWCLNLWRLWRHGRLFICIAFLDYMLSYVLFTYALHPYWVCMIHEVLLHVVDVASPDTSRDGVGRMKWQLALFPEMCCCIFSYTFICIPIYTHVIECMCCWVLDVSRCCDHHSVIDDCEIAWCIWH